LDLSSSAYGLRSLRYDFMPGHQGTEINRNGMKNVQTPLGADTDSDHNLMVAKLCTRWKDEEADVSGCWITLRKRQDNGVESGSSSLHSVDNCVWKRL
jgi:hypothetical protein